MSEIIYPVISPVKTRERYCENSATVQMLYRELLRKERRYYWKGNLLHTFVLLTCAGFVGVFLYLSIITGDPFLDGSTWFFLILLLVEIVILLLNRSSIRDLHAILHALSSYQNKGTIKGIGSEEVVLDYINDLIAIYNMIILKTLGRSIIKSKWSGDIDYPSPKKWMKLKADTDC